MLDPTFLDAVRDRFRHSPFTDWFGAELVSAEEGTVQIGLELQPHHLNPGGIIHGGVIAAMLDIAIGLSLRTRLPLEFAHVTTQLNISYLKPCREGRVIATGTAIHQGRRTGYGEASLADPNGRLLSKATGSFLIFPRSEIADLGVTDR